MKFAPYLAMALIVGSVFGILVTDRLSEQKLILGKQVAIPTVSATPTLPPTTPAAEPTIYKPATKPSTVVLNDPDPIIDCRYTYLGVKKIRQSLCKTQFECQIGNAWYFYTDRNKCNQDQSSYWQKWHGTSTYTSSSINCTVTYPSGITSTYYVTPEMCKKFQDQANSLGENYNPPAYPTQDPQIAIDQHNSQVRRCQSDVAYKYQGLLQSCNNRFGDSSAAEACRTIYSNERQSEYDACGSIL